MLVFNHKIKHCAYGGSSERRMFTIGFQQRHRDEDEQVLRDELADLVRFWHPRAYGDVMIETAGPARMRHLEQRLALDGHMAWPRREGQGGDGRAEPGMRVARRVGCW